MAAAMARKYGSDVIVPYSAGTAPASAAEEFTRTVLAEKNIELGEYVPKRFSDLNPRSFDMVVNISGSRLSGTDGVLLESWNVEDPVGQSDEALRKVRDELEMRVMQLILRIRTGKFDSQPVSSRQ